MAKLFNPNAVKTLYAPRLHNKDIDDWYTGVFYPTVTKAKKVAEEILERYNNFDSYEIISISADLSSLFRTHLEMAGVETTPQHTTTSPMVNIYGA